MSKNEAKPASVPKRQRNVALATMLIELTNPLNGHMEKAYAMADTGASNTHVSSSVGRKLGLHGVLGPFVVGSHGGRIQEYKAVDCNVHLGAVDDSYQGTVAVKCYPNPCGQIEAMDWREIKNRWSHLRHLPLPAVVPDKRVHLIIGTDCMDAIVGIV